MFYSFLFNYLYVFIDLFGFLFIVQCIDLRSLWQLTKGSS